MTLNPEATMMFVEAGEAADVVAAQCRANADRLAALGQRLRDHPPAMVLSCGRGSSDHAATFAKYLIETRLGVVTASLAPSVASVYGAVPRAAGALCLAISQSGKSPDLLAALRAAKKGGAYCAALVNVENSPLAGLADAVLPLRAGPERSVAATKSYIASLAGLVDLVAAWSEDAELAEALAAAPELLRGAWEADWSSMVEALRDARGLYVIGRGIGLGIAQEAALKFKETCGLHAEAFSAAEVRHGPMALVGPGFPMLLFRQTDESGSSIDDLAAEVVARGGKALVVGAPVKGAIPLPSIGAHPVIEPMLQIQSFYRAVNALSVARGFDPDKPPHLAKVTETI